MSVYRDLAAALLAVDRDHAPVNTGLAAQLADGHTTGSSPSKAAAQRCASARASAGRPALRKGCPQHVCAGSKRVRPPRSASTAKRSMRCGSASSTAET